MFARIPDQFELNSETVCAMTGRHDITVHGVKINNDKIETGTSSTRLDIAAIWLRDVYGGNK